MNPNNYASLEASKQLVEAGIKMETEAAWCPFGRNGEYKLLPIEYFPPTEVSKDVRIPAPSMAEVWRELPEYIEYKKDDRPLIEYLRIDKNGDGSLSCGYGQYSEMTINDNPTDALIDLLIWVRKEANHE